MSELFKLQIVIFVIWTAPYVRAYGNPDVIFLFWTAPNVRAYGNPDFTLRIQDISVC